MRIVFERPPNFEEIDAKFRIAGKPIIFAYGDVIYNPMRVTIPPHLIVHEGMHGYRQKEFGVENWWRSYIDSDWFRREEEILAHQAEYRALVRGSRNRADRRACLKQTAKRLASPLYGRMIGFARARAVLVEAAI